MSRRPAARFHCAELEPRTAPAVLTVLAPDGPTAAADLPATLDLATAIATRTGTPVAGVNDSVARYDAAAESLTPPAARTGFLVLDWSGTPNTAAAASAAGTKLADYIRTLLPTDGKLDLHFIGRGTGAVVNLAAIRALATDDAHVGRLQMTSLNAVAAPGDDPQVPPNPPTPPPPPIEPPPTDPPTGSGGGEGGGPIYPYPLPPYPEPIPFPPNPPVGLETLTSLPVPLTVDLADNYYVTAGTPGLRFRGEGPGTEIDLTAAVQAWPGRGGDGADAAEVRDWYLWTADLAGATDYRDPALNTQRAGFAGQGFPRSSLFSQDLDLNKDGDRDDLAGGANIGFGQSIRTLFAPRERTSAGLDLAFVIDTTGSMHDDIDAVKARAVEILQTLRQQVDDVRVGVVLYRDFPDGTHGAADDYQTRVAIGFTTDLNAVEAAIRAIEVGGGNDWSESVYAGLAGAFDPGQDLGAWRDGQVRRSLILMGDAPPQGIEPGTEFTKTSTLLRAVAAGVDVAAVATTATADAYWQFKSIADLTGGNFYFTGPEQSPVGDWDDFSYGGGYGGPGPIDWFPGVGDYPTPPPMPGTPPPPPPPVAEGAGGGGFAAAAADSVLAAVRGIGDGFVRGDDPTPTPRGRPPVFVAPGPGGGGAVSVVDPATGSRTGTVPAFDGAVPGGVRTASADFNRDGVADLLAGTGPGSAPRVRVIDGATGAELFAVSPFEESFTGGVYVAAGDLTGDGVPDVVITPDEGGGPRCRVFDGATGFALVADFYGIDDPNFRGGARTAIGDVNGDGTGDLVVAAGFQGGPRVAGYEGRSVRAGQPPRRVFADFFAFEETLRNGVFVAAGDMDGDGCAEVIVGGGPGGGPRVTAYDGEGLTKDRYEVAANFFAGDEADRGGVRVAAKDLDGDGRADLVAGSGAGDGSRVRAYLGTAVAEAGVPPERFGFDAFPGLADGVFVG